MTSEEYGVAFERGFKVTVKLLMNHGLDCETAGELAQSAWVRGFERLADLRNSGSVVSWVNAIAIHQIRSEMQCRKRMSQPRPEDEPEAPPEINLAAIDVRNALKKCRPRQSRLLRSVYVDERCCEDVARDLGISRGALHSRLSRARKELKEKFNSKTPDGSNVRRDGGHRKRSAVK